MLKSFAGAGLSSAPESAVDSSAAERVVIIIANYREEPDSHGPRILRRGCIPDAIRPGCFKVGAEQRRGAGIQAMKMNFRRIAPGLAAMVLLACGLPPVARGYSVLAHEAIVDAEWQTAIQPLLLARYPGLTVEQLQDAHAHAYGGCIIQDMGYYPFGNHFFSDLLHYVRTGDFVMALLEESQNANQLAFALGALAHYAADTQGHPRATNRAVAILYPRLRGKYGREVTYEDDPKVHVLVEFSFDVIQVAGGGYMSESYHDFIGFKVSKDLLGRAFKKTYGLDIHDLFFNEDLAIGTFRHAAGTIIPQMTKLAWKKRRAEIQKASPHVTRQQFIYRISRRKYQKEYGTQYKKPGLLPRILVALFSVIPRVGGLRDLSFKPPTPQTERMFLDSMVATRNHYRVYLQEVGTRRLLLPNRDFDTGRPTRPGEYKLTDRTYGELVGKLQANNFKSVQTELRFNILSFYAHYQPPYATQPEQARWNGTDASLYKLRDAALMSPSPLQIAAHPQPKISQSENKPQ